MNLGMRALALTALLAVPLAAQQPMEADSAHHARGGMMGRGMMGHGMMGGGMSGMMMMGGMEFAPAHLLALNGELSLTAQQITALTALRDAAKRARDAGMDKIKTHLDELRTALDAATPDTMAVRTHFLAAHDAMGQAHLAMLITNARAKAILTDAQRTQLAQMHRGMMEGRRRGGPGAWHGRPAMRGI
ncbi:MAG TPA: Spy/CpxP family protein refolding chaperone [Gemmatimonadales bacterium]|jgi:Spy/CpxP family protein refolding chaperone|nr:Spy/CpxP family protein refolding chaperone [Gemmatimonadales bacterium]